jgi:hypothetical protein
VAHAREVVRLVVAHPQQLGQREAGEHGVGDVAEDVFAAQLGVDGVHLRLAALVAPDQRGADHGARAVQHHQAVHLAGKADAFHLRAGNAGFGEHAANGETAASHQFSGRCSAHSGRSMRMSS